MTDLHLPQSDGLCNQTVVAYSSVGFIAPTYEGQAVSADFDSDKRVTHCLRLMFSGLLSPKELTQILNVCSS